MEKRREELPGMQATESANLKFWVGAAPLPLSIIQRTFLFFGRWQRGKFFPLYQRRTTPQPAVEVFLFA
jgi:hypothetical protein